MTTQKQRAPTLRFSEFEGEWEEKKLGNISMPPSYGMNSASTVFDGVNKYIRITDIDESTNAFVPNPLTSPKESIEEKYKLIDGDIVFTRTGASTGKSYLYNPNDGNLYFAGFLIKFNINKAVPKFILLQLLKERYRKWVSIMSIRSGQPGINADEYSRFKVDLPTKKEQLKISSFLSSVDTKIDQLTKKKALLERYKKGVAKNILSQKISFQDVEGKGYPEWEERRLGDILGYEQPTKYLVSSTEYDDTYTTPVLTAGKTFVLGYTNEKHGIFKDNLPVIIFDDFTTAFHYVDFAFKAKSSAMKMLVLKCEDCTLRFIYESMKTILFPLGEHKRYWISEYQNVDILCPSLPEQQKIADFLSSIDEKIEQVGRELEKAKTFKKGLLQQMFV